MKLYYVPMTRSLRPRWLLEELGVPYELVRLDPSKKEQKSPEYLAIHPLGHVPALVDGELKMFESAAICAYLADRYIDKGLAPALDAPERASYHQWMYFAVAELEQAILKAFVQFRKPEAERDAKQIAEATARFGEVAAVLERHLETRRFMAGERFSTADVLIGANLIWARAMKLLGGHAILEGYVARLVERPAYQRARAD